MTTGAIGCNREAYIDRLLRKYRLDQCNATKLPMNSGTDLALLPLPAKLAKANPKWAERVVALAIWRAFQICIHFYCAIIGVSFTELKIIEAFVWVPLSKIIQSTRSDGMGAGCVRLRSTRDFVWTRSFRRGWARFVGNRTWRSGTLMINSTLLTPGYLFLNTLHPAHAVHLVGWYGRNSDEFGTAQRHSLFKFRSHAQT